MRSEGECLGTERKIVKEEGRREEEYKGGRMRECGRGTKEA